MAVALERAGGGRAAAHRLKAARRTTRMARRVAAPRRAAVAAGLVHSGVQRALVLAGVTGAARLNWAARVPIA